MSSSSPMLQDEILEKSVLQQVKEGWKQAGRAGVSMGKNFGKVGLLFSGTECAIEYYRAKTDIWNSLSAGCFSGAVLAGRAGPKAMIAGCATFSAFSYAIDHFTGRYDDSNKVKHETKF